MSVSGIDMNQAVFTTRHVVKDGETIAYVFHSEDDGAWTFFSDRENSITDAMVLALHEIIAIDGTLSELLDMPEGKMAFRKSKNDTWVITNIK